MLSAELYMLRYAPHEGEASRTFYLVYSIYVLEIFLFL